MLAIPRRGMVAQRRRWIAHPRCAEPQEDVGVVSALQAALMEAHPNTHHRRSPTPDSYDPRKSIRSDSALEQKGLEPVVPPWD